MPQVELLEPSVLLFPFLDVLPDHLFVPPNVERKYLLNQKC
jgi:hypothetical protein